MKKLTASVVVIPITLTLLAILAALSFLRTVHGSALHHHREVSLLLVLAVAVASLLYAWALNRQVNRAPLGTPKMQEVAAAIREGANSYLAAQFRRIAPLIALITVLLAVTYTGTEPAFRWGRAGAFLVGAMFSWTVGFVGMRLATTGNLRVAAAAVSSYGDAMQLGYRTGTVTGMLTDGLGLLGGTVIFLIYGVQAYEALLGIGRFILMSALAGMQTAV